MSEFDTMADAIYDALPLEGESYRAAAEGAAAKLIADGWMSRAAAGVSMAREAELIAEPLRRRVRELEAYADDLNDQIADCRVLEHKAAIARVEAQAAEWERIAAQPGYSQMRDWAAVHAVQVRAALEGEGDG